MDKEDLKILAMHLRVFVNQNGSKLKNCHAHELVAAFFGYKSRASLLTDHNFSGIVPESPYVHMIDKIMNLNGIDSNLPTAIEMQNYIKSLLVNNKEY